MNTVDLGRLAEVEKQVKAAHAEPWVYAGLAFADLHWVVTELRAALAAIHDLQQESAAYRRGAEDMRETAARRLASAAFPADPVKLANLVRALPLAPEGRP